MGGGEYPGITIDPEGLERLPEEARGPCEAILRKKRRGGHDIGRLIMFNVIAIYNGGPFLSLDESKKLIDRMSFAALAIYQKYKAAYEELRKELREASYYANGAAPALTALQAMAEAIEYANADYPACKWDRYSLEPCEASTQTWARMIMMRKKAIKGIIACERARYKLKIAGEALKTPGLEKMTDNSIKPIRAGRESYNIIVERASAMLAARPLSDRARQVASDWLEPLPTSWRQPSKRAVLEAKRGLRLEDFAVGFEDMEDIFIEDKADEAEEQE